MELRQIRADYDRETIVMYQAYPKNIAEAALSAGTFVAPFSFHRMTWIKPSYLWLMERSNWGRRAGQERTLAVRIKQSGFLRALELGVLTSFEPGPHKSPQLWEESFSKAKVHVQWDPERSFRGAKLPHRSIQVGLSRHVIREFTDKWIVKLEDLTALTSKIRQLRDEGRHDQAKRLLPKERPFAVSAKIAAQLGL